MRIGCPAFLDWLINRASELAARGGESAVWDVLCGLASSGVGGPPFEYFLKKMVTIAVAEEWSDRDVLDKWFAHRELVWCQPGMLARLLRMVQSLRWEKRNLDQMEDINENDNPKADKATDTYKAMESRHDESGENQDDKAQGKKKRRRRRRNRGKKASRVPLLTA